MTVANTTGMPTDENGRPIPALCPDDATKQDVAYTGTAALSAAFAAGTRAIRICPDTDCRFAIGAAPVATATSARLPADGVEWLGVRPGWKISIIREASDGTMNIVEAGALN